MLRATGFLGFAWLAAPLVTALAACSSASSPSDSTSAPPPADTTPPPADDTPDPRLAGRPYQDVLHVPPSYDGSKAVPLVLAFHGYGSGDNGPLLEKFFKFKPVADDQGFLYITPNGTKDSSGEQFWNGTDACCDFDGTKPDDVGYVRAIVDDVAKHYNVDKKRVYAVGLSGGAFFVHRLACDTADVFAAVVSMSGATYLDASACKPSEPVAVVELHGEKDEVVSYTGGTTAGGLLAAYPSAKDTVAHWAGYDGCPGALVDTGTTYDIFTLPGAETQVARYDGCAHAAVELWAVKDGPHAPAMNADFAKTIWSFFAAHPKP